MAMSKIAHRAAFVLAGSLLLALSAYCDDARADYQFPTDSSDVGVQAGLARCQRYDRLQAQGTTSPAISTCDTLSPDWNGLRDDLAGSGWLIQGGTVLGGTFDLLHHGERPQLYIGQDPTYRANTFVTATYDLSRLGFAGDALLLFNANLQAFSFAEENPRGFAINSLYVSQRFDNGRVQLQYGYDEIANQFYGFSLGTNSTTSPAGVGSSIPYEVGFIFNKSAPEINLRLASDSGHFYERAGITRSVDPQGPQADWDNNNFLGLKWHIPGAGALYVNELGYQRDPAPRQHMMWLRQGVMYNASRFPDFRGGHANHNYAYYLVGDYQLTRPDAAQPFRGVYVNVKADYAPPDRNVYASDAGVTLYVLGPFRQPSDAFALSYTFNRLSKTFERMQQANGYTAVDYSRNYALSYVHRLTRGVYLSNQLSYTVNPIPSPKRPGALTWMSSLSLSY